MVKRIAPKRRIKPRSTGAAGVPRFARQTRSDRAQTTMLPGFTQMLKKHVIAVAAAFSLTMLLDGVASARCACLDTQDDIANQAQQRASIDKLASESNAAIARQFLSNGLKDDAAEYSPSSIGRQ